MRRRRARVAASRGVCGAPRAGPRGVACWCWPSSASIRPTCWQPRGASCRVRITNFTFTSAPVDGKGKFENLDELLLAHPAHGHDWLLVVDDDVALPRGFLDAFLFLAERFALRLAQPAHRHHSHAAFDVTRRRPGSVARETAFVEIGPVSAFHATVFDRLLPFPPLRYGWGLDAHWSALAARNGWPIGVIDATPVRHRLRRIASSYDPAVAIAEAREFLADRPYTTAADAQRTIRTHRSW